MDLQDESFPYLSVRNWMFPMPFSIDHVHELYHRIVVVIHRFATYKMLLVVRNDVVRHHFDLTDLSIVELTLEHSIISCLNHEP